MGSLKELDGTVVGLDTSPFIYYLETHVDYIQKLDAFFEALIAGRFTAVTSTITLLEVLVQPLRRGDEALAHRYNDILVSSPNITLISISKEIAELAADLRAHHQVKTADAIQLAASIHAGAASFLTNDRRLSNNCGIEILYLGELEL